MIYHLEIEAKFCKVEVLLNGFPVFSLKGYKPSIFSKPINAALVGHNNLLNFTMTPSENLSSDETFSIKGCVKEYQSNHMTGPDQGKRISDFSFERTLIAEHYFDNEKFNYSGLLRENKKIKDEKMILDYAEQLQDLLKSKSIDKLISEFEPKLADYAIAYSVDTQILVAQFKNHLTDNYFPNNPKINFMKDEISIRPWCDKRIWEVGVGAEYDEFMLTEPNDAGIEYATKIFVGLIDNQLKVVR